MESAKFLEFNNLLEAKKFFEGNNMKIIISQGKYCEDARILDRNNNEVGILCSTKATISSKLTQRARWIACLNSKFN